MTVQDAVERMSPEHIARLTDDRLLKETLATTALLDAAGNVDDYLCLITIHERLLDECLKRKGKVWPLFQDS